VSGVRETVACRDEVTEMCGWETTVEAAGRFANLGGKQ